MEDWAETRAREYNTRWWKNDWEKPNAALAALLREVEGRTRSETLVHCCVHADEKAPYLDGCECVICHRQRTLAEVRRVVITVRDGWMRGEVGVAVPPPPDDITKTCDQILLRLESL